MSTVYIDIIQNEIEAKQLIWNSLHRQLCMPHKTYSTHEHALTMGFNQYRLVKNHDEHHDKHKNEQYTKILSKIVNLICFFLIL